MPFLALIVAALILAGCAAEPSVVTKVEPQHIPTDPALFVCADDPGYPPRPVSFTDAVQYIETLRAAHADCKGRLAKAGELDRAKAIPEATERR